MGLDWNGTKFLLYAKKTGVSFAKTAMVGRQTLNLDSAQLHKNLIRFGYELTADRATHILTAANRYAEPFLQFLGADQIESFDASNYENATCIHDFNLPIAEEFKNKFTTVLDGGTLEHIFNFPTAIKNCMEMVATDGHFLSITPTNNFLGHGFYQFSPELFFRIFTARNGFHLEQVIIFEDFAHSNWYTVTDPDAVRERVTLINHKPAYLLIIAKKIQTVPIFSVAPQQSDYAALWQQKSVTGSEPEATATNPAANLIGQTIRAPIRALRQIKHRVEQTRGAIHNRRRHFKKND